MGKWAAGSEEMVKQRVGVQNMINWWTAVSVLRRKFGLQAAGIEGKVTQISDQYLLNYVHRSTYGYLFKNFYPIEEKNDLVVSACKIQLKWIYFEPTAVRLLNKVWRMMRWYPMPVGTAKQKECTWPAPPMTATFTARPPERGTAPLHCPTAATNLQVVVGYLLYWLPTSRNHFILLFEYIQGVHNKNDAVTKCEKLFDVYELKT